MGFKFAVLLFGNIAPFLTRLVVGNYDFGAKKPYSDSKISAWVLQEKDGIRL